MTLVLGLLSLSAWAQPAYHCSSGESERKIEVLYLESGKKLPCKVKYTQIDEQNAKKEEILWGARSKVGFCEEKALGLSGRLQASGWKCTSKID